MAESAYIEFLDYREQAAMPPEGKGQDSKQSILGAAKENLQNGAGGNRKAAGESKVLQVQFQPSSLQFQAGAAGESKSRGNISKPADTGSQKPENPEPEKPHNLTMSVSLIFDRSIYEDSDVTGQVEGFLAAARNPFTRQASFNWGELYYKGTITDVQVSYEMFESTGVPVRAKLDLSIMLNDTSQMPPGKEGA